MRWLAAFAMLVACLGSAVLVMRLIKERLGERLSIALSFAVAMAWVPIIGRAIEGRPMFPPAAWLEIVIAFLLGTGGGYFFLSRRV
jgi:hypothetical protein